MVIWKKEIVEWRWGTIFDRLFQDYIILSNIGHHIKCDIKHCVTFVSFSLLRGWDNGRRWNRTNAQPPPCSSP
jgi:hypothetical protein